jgi:hypothetical protein
MHFDTRLLIYSLTIVDIVVFSIEHADDQSYLSLIEYHRGSSFTSLIVTSPHGGFLGSNLTLTETRFVTNRKPLSISLPMLPVAGCYSNELGRCIYTVSHCQRAHNGELSFHGDARCMLKSRISTSAMYWLTKAITDAFIPSQRPFVILNKLTRQYVDPAEDLLPGTFLLESAVRVHTDYHRLIAMAKESIRTYSLGLLIEFVFHQGSLTVQLGYEFDSGRLPTVSRSVQSTINELLLRCGSSVIIGNNSLAYYLRLNGFDDVVPWYEEHNASRQSTYSTRIHADRQFNAILFSYPIERLRTHSLRQEAIRIAKAIEAFMYTNKIQRHSSSFASLSSANSICVCMLLLFASLAIHRTYQ